jgi:hypothetical protein
MKTHVKISVDEAQQRLTQHLVDAMPFSDNQVSVEIELPPVKKTVPRLENVPKAELVRFVRTLADDIGLGRVKMENCHNPLYGHVRVISLLEAEKYVEKFLNNYPEK